VALKNMEAQMSEVKEAGRTPGIWRADYHEVMGTWRIMSLPKEGVKAKIIASHLKGADAEYIANMQTNFDALLEAAYAVIDDTEISRVAHREFCGKLDDLKEVIRQCGGRG
jgi:hypothetical protein